MSGFKSPVFNAIGKMPSLSSVKMPNVANMPNIPNMPSMSGFSPSQIPGVDSLMNYLNGAPNGLNAIAQAQKLMQQTNQSPEALVKSLMDTGKITQGQFDQAAQIASMITGKKI